MAIRHSPRRRLPISRRQSDLIQTRKTHGWRTALRSDTRAITTARFQIRRLLSGSTKTAPEAYNNRGAAYKSKGEYDKAIADLTEAIRLKPALFDAFYNRAAAYAGKGENTKAVKDYSEAIRIAPRLAVAFRDRGIVYQRLGETAKAGDDFAEARRLGPRSFGRRRLDSAPANPSRRERTHGRMGLSSDTSPLLTFKKQRCARLSMPLKSLITISSTLTERNGWQSARPWARP